MKALKILAALLSLAPLVALACAGGIPEALSGTPEPTAGLVSPTATPLTGVGICYRTPSMQDWILSRLQSSSCAAVSDAELYRITDTVAFTGLKAGDLAGLVSAESLVISDGHCGDWENPEYVASILNGFNPDGHILIDAGVGYPPLPNSGSVEDNIRTQIHGTFLFEASVAETEQQIRLLFANDIDRLGGWSEIERLKKRALAVQRDVNAKSRAIAEAVKNARNHPSSVMVEGVGVSVLGGEGAHYMMPGTVLVQVKPQPGIPYPPCQEG